MLNSLLKFADDTKLFGVVDNVAQHDQLQRDLCTIVEWSRTWQMEFNVDKCNVLHFGNEKNGMEYCMGNKSLKCVSMEKDLGVIITEDLKVASNCQAAYGKASRALGMIRRNIVFKSREILLPLYKSLVRPLVEYCTPAWSPHYHN